MKTFAVAGSPHVPAPTSVRRVMAEVLLALVPGIAAHVWYFGSGLLLQIVLACAFALVFEAAMLRLRGVRLAPFLGDLSAPVTAVLFALCIPPLCPWWVTAVAMAAALIFAKHLYGGLGHNLFNPAMVGYVVVLICFPRELSHWLAPAPLAQHGVDFGTALATIFQGHLPTGVGWDEISSATPLDTLRSLAHRDLMMGEIHGNPVFGDYGGKGWEWIANWYALGGLYLSWRRIVPWQVPLGVLGSVVLLSVPFYLSDPDMHPFPLQHVFSGGLMLGAWFIASDPVTGCTTPRGRLVFGAGVGVLTLVIRRWGAFPDGVAFAVLLMNCAAPLIDRWTPTRVFGRGRHE
jgi:electron transport complex protein RnfD